jgi:4-hydroxy-4-methyl-2-oxoglutarate aldolase
VTQLKELERLGVATVHEAQDKTGLVDIPLVQIVPGSRAAGRARTALCANADNLMVHAAVAHAEPGDVLVLTMPDPTPVALVGDLLATQALDQGVAAILVDGAVRDVAELRELGLPIWARFVRAQGAAKDRVGELDVPVVVGGARIERGDVVVLDADGAVVVAAARVDEVALAAREREAREHDLRARYAGGERSYDVNDLRRLVEGQHPA